MQPQPVLMADLQPGHQGIIDHFLQPDDSFSIALQEIGLTPGTLFKIVRRAVLGDPIEIAFKGYRITLRKTQTRLINVHYCNESSCT
jgi:ferrous iron transport protein A